MTRFKIPLYLTWLAALFGVISVSVQKLAVSASGKPARPVSPRGNAY